MSLLRNRSIAWRIALSFALCLALLGAVAGTNLWASSSMTASARQISSVTSIKALDANSVGGLAAYIHESQTRFVLNRGASYHDHLGDVHDFDVALAKLARDSKTPADLAHLAAVRSAYANVRHFDAVLYADVRAGRQAQAEATVDGAANDAADALARAADAYVELARTHQASAVAHFESVRSTATWAMLIITVAGVLLAAGLGYLLIRAIRDPLHEVERVAEAIAEGDLEQSITVHGETEIARMAAAFERVIAYLRSLAAAAERVAAGDLTTTIEPASPRDTLGAAFATLAANMRRMVGEIHDASSSFSTTSQQMASTSEEAGRAVGEIAGAVSNVSEGAERQVQMVDQARQSATETAEQANAAREVAREGVGAAQDASVAMAAVRDATSSVTDAIGGLAAKSEQIGGIVETITGIAGQTNLLALNAAIEAARAGEQGKGFAVVAEEVRKLAEESQQAAASISELIAQIQEETQRTVDVVEDGARKSEEGVAIVEQTRDAFRRIGGSVDGVTTRVEQIASAAQQIAASAASMQTSMSDVASVAERSSAGAEQVSASTQETSASAQEIAASAQELAKTAEELNRLVGQFKLAA